MAPKPIICIQGAQWGSEGKGMVAAALGRRRKAAYCVRTGAVNAGHTIYHHRQPFKMQQLPVGWTHGADLVLGAGAMIHPDVFAAELALVRDQGYNGPVYVDHHAGLHLPVHSERSGLSNRHHLIGATGKGCSEAIIDKIRLRGMGGQTFEMWLDSKPTKRWPWDEMGVKFVDAAELLNGAYDAGEQILLEGTQGTLLDLHLGPYPYTTHKQCTAAAWITEAGLSPSLDYEVVLVARTFPIRVAGNSGPMPNEISWVALTEEINRKLQDKHFPPRVHASALVEYERCLLNAALKAQAEGWPMPTGEAGVPSLQFEKWTDAWRVRGMQALSELPKQALAAMSPSAFQEISRLFEFTTVTKKLRRVARLDLDLLKYSVMVNRPKWVCLTFLNYVFPEMWGYNDMLPQDAPGMKGWLDYVAPIEHEVGCPVRHVTTGPEDSNFLSTRE